MNHSPGPWIAGQARNDKYLFSSTAGGPRLKGSPGEDAERTASCKTTAIVLMAAERPRVWYGGVKPRPAEPQRSQCPPADETSSLPG